MAMWIGGRSSNSRSVTAPNWQMNSPSWAAGEGPKTHVGKQWVVLGGSGIPVAVIETVELTQRRFDEVDGAFADDEGEDDRTLTSWRRAHQNYFGRQGTFAPDMLLYCERFRLVARIDPEGSLDLPPNEI